MRINLPSIAGLQHICKHLRERDQRELYYSGGDCNGDGAELGARMASMSEMCVKSRMFSADDDEPVAFLLAYPITPNTLDCGMLATDRWGEIASSVTRFLVRKHRAVMFETQFHRAQAQVWARHDDALNWLGLLGFEQESVLRAFGREGEDFIQMAYVRDHVRSES